jgi:hypothetical protein
MGRFHGSKRMQNRQNRWQRGQRPRMEIDHRVMGRERRRSLRSLGSRSSFQRIIPRGGHSASCPSFKIPEASGAAWATIRFHLHRSRQDFRQAPSNYQLSHHRRCISQSSIDPFSQSLQLSTSPLLSRADWLWTGRSTQDQRL